MKDPTVTAVYAYCGYWNDLLHKPRFDSRWFTEEEARALYESAGGAEFEIVDGAARDGAITPFVLSIVVSSSEMRVRSVFYNAAGSVWRSIDYKTVDGRLFKWIVWDYKYPDDEKSYERDEAVEILNGTFEPTGDGTLGVDNKAKPPAVQADLHDVPVEGHWLDFPTFGDWADLANPNYGDESSAA